jgi:dimethylglycine dehydrogenase
VRGPAAHAWLEKVMANTIPTKTGTLKLTPMLTHAGKLIGEFSVAKLGDEEFLLIGSGVVDRFHHRWWEQFLPAEGVTVESATAKLCGYSVSGPKARELLSRVAYADVSQASWPYGKVGRIEIGPVSDAILVRVAYTGELGYEIWVQPESQVPLLHALLRQGADLGAKLAGIRALNSLRVEKGYGAWGLEYSPDYSPFDAAMGHLVKFEKPAFVGREAALQLSNQARKYTYAFFEIDVQDADPWGGEPILDGEKVVGFITSAAYGHRTDKSLAIGYMQGEFQHANVALSTEILGTRCAVRILDKPAYDPQSTRMKG